MGDSYIREATMGLTLTYASDEYKKQYLPSLDIDADAMVTDELFS